MSKMTPARLLLANEVQLVDHGTELLEKPLQNESGQAVLLLFDFEHDVQDLEVRVPIRSQQLQQSQDFPESLVALVQNGHAVQRSQLQSGVISFGLLGLAQLVELSQRVRVDFADEPPGVHEERVPDFEAEALDVRLDSHQVCIVVQNVLYVRFFQKLEPSDFALN